MAKKKSYNPFKMLGAWVGFALGISPLFMFPNLNIDLSNLSVDFISIIGLFGIIGFLIGWGIHSLIRKVRK